MTTKSKISLSQRSRWAEEQAIGFLMQQAVENRDVISLAAGLVDESSLPVEECRQAFAELLSHDDKAKLALQYGTTAGSERLRTSVLKLLTKLEQCSVDQLGIDANQIVLTTGSQQLLALVADALLDPGDICLVSAPTYFVFLGVLNGVGARTIAVESDDSGMRIDRLEECLQQLKRSNELHRLKMIYVVSDFENPSGISLSASRRKQVVELAKQWSIHHRIMVLEDAAYRELRYNGDPLPSVWSFDENRETVILAQTFSKSFSPGVRVGFGVIPRELVGVIGNLKGNDDFGSANLNQHLMATVLESERYEQHVEIVRQSYRTKRDTMLSSLHQEFSDLPDVRWEHPRGGLYVWLTLPKRIETGFSSKLFEFAVRTNHVMYVPGELFYPTGDPAMQKNQMRLSFGVQSLDGIREGIGRLAASVRDLPSCDE